MGTITEEIKASFKNGSTLTKLIYINLGVFIIVKAIFVLFFLFVPSSGGDKEHFFINNILAYLMIPADLLKLAFRPWSAITYMFLHFGFLHILFNLLWLFWFGRIFQKYLTNKQLLTTYLLGGLIGGGMFVLAYNLFPGLTDQLVYAKALGASASVTAIVIAVSFYAPNHEIYLLLFGPVKIKYIAVVYIIFDILQIASVNAGGHIAHLGGALYGYLFILQLKKGKDIGKGFSSFMDSLMTVFQSKKTKLKVSYKSEAQNMTDIEYNKVKSKTNKELDQILDKIAKYGYESLSKSEKEILFKMSNQK